jgi:hypothetical protein
MDTRDPECRALLYDKNALPRRDNDPSYQT